MKLIDVIKQTDYVQFRCISGGEVWYDCMRRDVGPTPLVYDETILTFRIPLEDLAGGTFPRVDEQKGYYQRWIRKELEKRAEVAGMIETARKNWNPEGEP